MQSDDDEMMPKDVTCIFFGGPDRPIHYSTLCRGIAAGRYPKPVLVGPNSKRWLRSECRKARQVLIDARDGVREKDVRLSVPNNDGRCSELGEPAEDT